ncbi:MAG: PEGA domain-containing protein [Sandaracinaceae bacterium]
MRRSFACLVLLTLGTAAPASAQTGALWERGVAARGAGQDSAALEAFEADYREGGRMASLAQVGLAEQALGRWGAAHRHLERALSQPDAWVTSNRAPLDQALAEVQRHTGRLEVTVDHAGARVSVGGEDLGVTPLPPLWVTAGTVPLRIEKNGVVVDRSVVIQIGQTSRESVTLGPGAAGGGGPSALPIVGATVAGLGLASAVGMTITWILREEGAQRYVGDECVPEVGQTINEVALPDGRTCGELRGEIDTLTGLTIGLGVGAAVLVGVGLGLVFAGGSDSGQASVACAPGLGGVSCHGRF